MSPHLPVTPDEIAASALDAAKAGAAIVHLHARTPEDGRPTQEPRLFEQFLPRIKGASNVVVNLTTGGSQTMTVQERLQPALQLSPELASLNMGTINFGLYEMIPRYPSWRWDWEPGQSHLIFRAHEEAEEIVVIAAGGEPFVLDAERFGAVLLEQIQRDVVEDGEIFWGVAGADAGLILVRRDIQHPISRPF